MDVHLDKLVEPLIKKRINPTEFFEQFRKKIGENDPSRRELLDLIAKKLGQDKQENIDIEKFIDRAIKELEQSNQKGTSPQIEISLNNLIEPLNQREIDSAKFIVQFKSKRKLLKKKGINPLELIEKLSKTLDQIKQKDINSLEFIDQAIKDMIQKNKKEATPEVPMNKLIEQRIEKLNQIRDKGINPYPYKFVPTHNSTKALAEFDQLAESETKVRMAGRIMAIRKMGKALFFHFQDEPGKLQGYIKKNDIGDELWDLFMLLDLGDIVGLTGTMFTTKTGESTLKVTSFELLTKSLHPLPEKFHGLTDKETRYRQRYVDLIANPDVRQVFKTRSAIVKAIRNFLNDQGFMEVETPVLQPLYGGGIAEPFVTRHNKLDMKLYLRIADELYLKRLIVGGYDKVWEYCKDFRNEGMDRKHNPEFSMIELYQAYADYGDMMALFENLLRTTVTEVQGKTEITYGEHSIDFGPAFKRLSMVEAVKQYGGPDLSDFDYDKAVKLAIEAGIDTDKLINCGKIIESFFDKLVEPNLIQPTFIIDHPKDISPLAKVHRDDPNLSERFELFISGMECGNAFSELNDPLDQKNRFAEQRKAAEAGDAEAHPVDEDYLTALMYGMPPTGGLGIGVDRLVMLFTNQHSIQDVLFFPQMRPKGGSQTGSHSTAG